MPTLVEMRKWLSDAYPGQRWADKVKKMSDSQVFATYRRMQTNPKDKK